MTLEAAWQRLCNELPEKAQDVPVVVKRRSAERFAGFVEGFTGSKLPRWWEEALFSTGGHSKNRIFFWQPKSWPYHSGGRPNIPNDEVEINLPREVRCVTKGDFSVLQRKGTIVRIPKKVLDQLSTNMTLSLQGDRCIIATHCETPLAYTVFCVNRTTSKIEWEAEISPDNGKGPRGFSGHWWHCVEIIPREKSVLVFGATFNALYVVGLNSENGKQLFRFSSCGPPRIPPSK